MNCLDAETLAAWFDGGLSGAALEDVRAHVGGCARCQALVGALGRTRAAVPTAQPERASRWWLAWAVPAAAAATAVALWVAVPRPTNDAVAPSSTASLQKQEAQPQGVPPSAASAAAPAELAAPPTTAATPTLQDRARSDDAAPPAAAAASENDAAKQAASSLNETVSVRSAVPAPTASAERREDADRKSAVVGQLQARDAFAITPCGPMWPAPPPDVAGQITGGSVPSDTVCWIVGRGGTVLRSTDHQTWQRVNFPVPVDLSSVTAPNPSSATVVTVNGRTFSTTDGGVTWMER